MGERLNVLMVTGFQLDDPAGGVNTMIYTLKHHLATRCRVVLLENDWNVGRLVSKRVDGETRYSMRLRAPYAHGRPIRGLSGWIKSIPSTVVDMGRLLKTELIDVAHLHYGAPYQYLFPLVRRLAGVPYVLTLHRGDIMSFPALSAPDRVLFRYAVRGAGKVVCVSHWLARTAASTLNIERTNEVIENGIDTDALDAMYDANFESRSSFPVPAKFFLMVSNVTRYKAQDVAIKAWAQVRRHDPNVPLLIVGQRRETWDDCVRLINELNCTGVVRLLGSQPREVVVNLMRRAEGLILPSRSEGLPYVLLEAGALGTPVICSDIAPFLEVVENESTALVTPVEDDHAVAAAAIRILESKQMAQALGRSLAFRVRSDFSAARMAQRISLSIVRSCKISQLEAWHRPKNDRAIELPASLCQVRSQLPNRTRRRAGLLPEMMSLTGERGAVDQTLWQSPEGRALNQIGPKRDYA